MPEIILCDITRQYKNIRVTGDIKEKMPSKKRTFSKKTLIDSYSKFKTKTIKN